MIYKLIGFVMALSCIAVAYNLRRWQGWLGRLDTCDRTRQKKLYRLVSFDMLNLIRPVSRLISWLSGYSKLQKWLVANAENDDVNSRLHYRMLKRFTPCDKPKDKNRFVFKFCSKLAYWFSITSLVVIAGLNYGITGFPPSVIFIYVENMFVTTLAVAFYYAWYQKNNQGSKSLAIKFATVWSTACISGTSLPYIFADLLSFTEQITLLICIAHLIGTPTQIIVFAIFSFDEDGKPLDGKMTMAERLKLAIYKSVVKVVISPVALGIAILYFCPWVFKITWTSWFTFGLPVGLFLMSVAIIASKLYGSLCAFSIGDSMYDAAQKDKAGKLRRAVKRKNLIDAILKETKTKLEEKMEVFQAVELAITNVLTERDKENLIEDVMEGIEPIKNDLERYVASDHQEFESALSVAIDEGLGQKKDPYLSLLMACFVFNIIVNPATTGFFVWVHGAYDFFVPFLLFASGCLSGTGKNLIDQFKYGQADSRFYSRSFLYQTIGYLGFIVFVFGCVKIFSLILVKGLF